MISLLCDGRKSIQQQLGKGNSSKNGLLTNEILLEGRSTSYRNEAYFHLAFECRFPLAETLLVMMAVGRSILNHSMGGLGCNAQISCFGLNFFIRFCS